MIWGYQNLWKHPVGRKVDTIMFFFRVAIDPMLETLNQKKNILNTNKTRTLLDS